MKLREIYEKVYRRIDFSFTMNGKEYSQRVINVTFKYSNKEYNRVTSDTYVKFGYNIRDLVLKDCVCVKNGELIALKINSPISSPLSEDLLGKYFFYKNGCYHAKSNIKVLDGVSDLRNKLYKEGFVCDGIKYIRFKRSAGSSRVGKCLFVDEKLYKRMHKWEMCGIDVKNGQEIDLAALETYISLPMSSIIGTIEINANNILVIDDYDSKFKDKVIAVSIENKHLKGHEGIREVCNSIWDGQSLISPDLMGEYSDKGFLLLRNRFFKSACFNCNIQKFFQDYGITEISQLKGYTQAKSIKDIKLITTPNSIKYLKFGTLKDWLWLLDPVFGVVKYEKKTHFFNGRMVQLHYQLLNTLQLSQKEVDDLLEPSFDFLRQVKANPAVLRYFIKYQHEDNFNDTAAKSNNDIVYKMLGITDEFAKTKLYSDFRNNLIVSFKKNLRCGHVLVNGNYSTMLGNPVEMLLSTIGKFDGCSQLGVGHIHTIRFPFNFDILGSRSPHVTMGNVMIEKNSENKEIDRYFNLTSEIVCVNSINENFLNRLSGSDFDSDTVLLTDNKILLRAAKKNYSKFPVPTSCVPSTKKKRRYTMEEKADLDIKTGKNKIGENINLSQELNTLFWDKINSGVPMSKLKELYCDISVLDVLSNIEIDKAKKEYTIDSTQEISILKKKYMILDKDGKKIKPNFFGHVARTKGYYDSKKKNYKFHKTTMDYIQHSINRFRLPLDRNSFLPFSSLLKPSDFSLKNLHYSSVNRIIDLVRNTVCDIKRVWGSKDINFDLTSSEKYDITSEMRQSCIDYIDQIKIGFNSMYWLLCSIESKDCKDISNILFEYLFGAPNKSFYKLIQESKTPISELVEDVKGDINLYDYTFKCI